MIPIIRAEISVRYFRSRKQVGMDNKALQDRIGKLIDALAQGLYERKDTMRLCLLAALCGESVFMLGPPGIAKSLLARRLICAFSDSRAFEYLMTRFSTPEEVFGPLSIQALKDEGRYLRLTEGYLPDAEVVFLDEIWKAGPAILNTLLTVINERRFRNGEKEIRVPMRLLVTASNELPEEQSGLEALYDRMLIRLWLDRIQQKQNFRAMLTSRQDPSQDTVPATLKIEDEEYLAWQQALTQVSLGDALFEQLFQLRERLATLNTQSDETHRQSLYVSDRRWKKALRLLQASAFFNGRQQIVPLDLLLLKDCLWHDLHARELLHQQLGDFARHQAYEQDRLQFALQQQQQELAHVQEGMVQELGCQLESVQNPLLKRTTWQIDFKANGLDPRQPHFRLLFLTPCQLDPQQPERLTRYATLSRRDLLQWLRKGGRVQARLHQDAGSIELLLDIDHRQQLMVRDAANRPVPVAFARPGGVPEWLRQRWLEALEVREAALTELRRDIHTQRQLFTSHCPHLFLSSEWLLPIEESLLQLVQKDEALLALLAEAREALDNLLQYASRGTT